MRLPIVIASVIIVLVLPGGSALGATAYQASLVPSEVGALDLSEKCKVRVKNTGRIKVALKGVRAADGRLVTTDQSFGQAAVLTGDEYVLVVRGTVLSSFAAMAFEVNVPVELTNGKGSATSLTMQMLAGVMGAKRSVELLGVHLYGPLGGVSAQDCQINMDEGGIVLAPSVNPCVSTGAIGTAGITLTR